jgi:transposase
LKNCPNYCLKPVEKIDGKSTDDGKNTVKFLEELQTIYEGKKIILIWDGASYHTCKDVKNYLDKVNKWLPKKDWKLTLMLFAPNGPEQNPVEDAWLRGKNFLRKHFYENKTFRQVKDSFSNFLNSQIFNFNKIEWYFKIPQPV